MERKMPELQSKVLIIGGGFSGIASAIRLIDRFNSHDFHIYELNESFGGTWWSNRYPGCAVDIPAFFYSISTDPNKNWSKFFAPQEEILEYIDEVVEKRGLKEYATFNARVAKLDWDVEKEEWVATIERTNGEILIHRAKLVLSGRGGLVYPVYPTIPGLENDPEKRAFKGIYAHSGRWDPETSLKDKDVVVIGNGCSGAQIVPAAAVDAKSVSQFIRAKHWLLPQPSPGGLSPQTLRWIINHVLGVRLSRIIAFWLFESNFPLFNDTGYLASKVRDVQTKLATKYVKDCAPEKYHQLLLPDFKIGCKRRIFDDGYLKSLHRENVFLSDDPIVSVSENHVHTKSGKSYHADIIIAATGFSSAKSNSNVPIYGINKEENLSEYWDRTGISAYNVSQIPGYPNLFYLMGPNSVTGHSSVILQIENTLTYIEKVAGYIIRGSASSVDVKHAAYDRWKEEVREKSSRSVQLTGGCVSWYVKDGTNIALYPWSQVTYWWKAVRPKYNDQTYNWVKSDKLKAESQRTFVISSLLVVLASAAAYRLV